MRRDPPFGKLIPAYDPSVTGFKNLIPAASGTVIDLQSVVIASNGAAGKIGRASCRERVSDYV